MPSAAATGDAVDHATRTVAAEMFHGADGRAVRPCTPAHVTHRHLRLLDVHPGMNVLEIGTGSGYSAAVLAELVSSTGQVTTVDINPDLSHRARALYATHGHHVTTLVADGIPGHPPTAPYDRILVGATPPAIPHAWLTQLRPGGILLTGARIHDLPGSYAIAHITSHPDAVDNYRVEIHPGGYTPMATSQPPSAGITAHDPDQPRHILTATGDTDHRTAQSLLTCLRSPAIEPWTYDDDEEYLHLKNWLFAVDPAGLIEATTAAGTGIGIGTLGPGRTAHAAIVTDRHLLADAQDSPAATALRSLIRTWHESGTPPTQNLSGYLARTDAGWLVRVSTRHLP